MIAAKTNIIGEPIQQSCALTFCAERSQTEVAMTQRRPKSPGSFRDELGGLIERVAPPDRVVSTKQEKRGPLPVKDTAELNDRLFEKAWRKSD